MGCAPTYDKKGSKRETRSDKVTKLKHVILITKLKHAILLITKLKHAILLITKLF